MTSLKINRKLLPLKVNYFLINASHAGVLPFIAVYAKQMGIEANVVGYIYAIVSCITVFSRPLIGGIADHFQNLKFVLISLILIDIVADLGLNFIPASNQGIENYTNSSLICIQNSSYVMKYDMNACNKGNTSNCLNSCISTCSMCQVNSDICNQSRKASLKNKELEVLFGIPFNCTDILSEKCDTDIMMPCNEKCIGGLVECGNEIEVNPTLQILLWGISTAIICICVGSLASLSDAACFNALENKHELFGKQRMWGTIGWGTFTLVAGYLNQVFTGNSKTYNYAPGFYMMAALLAIDLMVLKKLELKYERMSENIFKDIGVLLAKPRILHFISQVFFVGAFVGFSRAYLFWYLMSLNASQLVLGFNSIVQAFLGELPFFFFSGWIITKIGHIKTFTLSLFFHGIKFVCYSFLYDPWLSLPIEILQGPCFGSFYAAMTSYAEIVSPIGTEATVQGIATATCDGLGMAAGSLLGGYGFIVLGGRATFFWTGAISFILAVVNSFTNACFFGRIQSAE